MKVWVPRTTRPRSRAAEPRRISLATRNARALPDIRCFEEARDLPIACTRSGEPCDTPFFRRRPCTGRERRDEESLLRTERLRVPWSSEGRAPTRTMLEHLFVAEHTHHEVLERDLVTLARPEILPTSTLPRRNVDDEKIEVLSVAARSFARRACARCMLEWGPSTRRRRSGGARDLADACGTDAATARLREQPWTRTPLGTDHAHRRGCGGRSTESLDGLTLVVGSVSENPVGFASPPTSS